MLHFSRWKIIATLLTCLAGVLFTLPNFFSKETVQSWPSWVPHQQLNLGLDLQRRRASAAVDGDRGRAQGLARDPARRCPQPAAQRQDRHQRPRHRQQGGAGAPRQARGRRRAAEGAARHGAADRQRPARHQLQRHRHSEGRRRRHHHNADRARPAAAHQQRRQRRHRDRAPPRRRDGHGRGQHRPAGHRAASSCRCRACRIPPSSRSCSARRRA